MLMLLAQGAHFEKYQANPWELYDLGPIFNIPQNVFICPFLCDLEMTILLSMGLCHPIPYDPCLI